MKDRVFQLCDQVREAAYSIHRYLGPGHLEKVYGNALVHRLRSPGLDVKQQHPLTVRDEGGTVIGELFADLFIEGQRIVGLKAARAFCDEHVAQLLGHLRASRTEHRAPVNFDAPKFAIKKFVVSESPPAAGTSFRSVFTPCFASLCVLCGPSLR
ncbi:MAG: GxxExxY protein [Verrucomicrobia bacterium]|nr:GxxExxY protein [Verrucomicrobiota bacterium]